ncbi:MAG: gephyrin-like molybdotransferase Glp [Acidimicrobiia bacterium]
MSALTPWEDVLEQLVGRAAPLEGVDLPIRDALGCAVAAEVVAPHDLPSFSNSSMDGYAVIARDITDSTATPLRIIGEIAAGTCPELTVRSGEAARIMTGAMMPAGADAVVPVERTSVHEEGGEPLLFFDATAEPGQFVRVPGSDTRAGARVLNQGDTVTPARIGLLAALGIPTVTVHRRVRVGLCSTGDELVPVGAPLAPGQIHDANGPMLSALLSEHNCELIEFGIVSDDASAVDALLEKAMGTCDVLLTSGGVSMGDHDEMKFALSRRGVLEWHQIAIRPAKPLATARLGELQVLALPGNPVSARVSFELFAVPVIRALGGHANEHRQRIWAQTDSEWKRKPDGKVHLDRVTLEHTPGAIVAKRIGVQASHVMSGLSDADALAFIPDGDGLAAHSPVEVIVLDRVLS